MPSNALPDPTWRMPKKPALYPGTQTRVFGFPLPVERQIAIADKFKLKPNSKPLARADAGFIHLMEIVPPEWKKYTTVTRRMEGGSGAVVHAFCLYHNTNVTQEEVDNLPSRDSIKQVWEILDCTEGPRWYKYAEV
ncbi:hypothetical protein D9613_008995 [Agrocybe pediades]|uniref:Uncharacterized protein n=1 Tax=Agrocybe pediades TaxID=84607 RepID=A0A8H4R579_9AGAR|nr:hypothetical protein D9613_008995 [Agrocybe pediades]